MVEHRLPLTCAHRCGGCGWVWVQRRLAIASAAAEGKEERGDNRRQGETMTQRMQSRPQAHHQMPDTTHNSSSGDKHARHWETRLESQSENKKTQKNKQTGGIGLQRTFETLLAHSQWHHCELALSFPVHSRSVSLLSPLTWPHRNRDRSAATIRRVGCLGLPKPSAAH